MLKYTLISPSRCLIPLQLIFRGTKDASEIEPKIIDAFAAHSKL